MSIIEQMQQELQELKESSNLRTLPDLIHEGRDVIANGQRMLNLSSNDYLGTGCRPGPYGKSFYKN